MVHNPLPFSLLSPCVCGLCLFLVIMYVEVMASYVSPNSSHTPHFVLILLFFSPNLPPLPSSLCFSPPISLTSPSSLCSLCLPPLPLLPPPLPPSCTQSVCFTLVATVYFAVQRTTFQGKDSVFHVMVPAPQVRGVLQTDCCPD